MLRKSSARVRAAGTEIGRWVTDSRLICLENDHVRLGILPPAGGRAVLLQRPEAANVLCSDSRLWEEAAAATPVPRLSRNDARRFKAYNGHIVWVGPQREWFNHQDQAPSWKNRTWPPDPWLEFAGYRVVKLSPRKVVLEGPASPVCGLALTKEYALAAGGGVTVKVTAVNTRRTPVSWDLWSNTRVAADATAFIPIRERYRIESVVAGHGQEPFALATIGNLYFVDQRQPLAAGKSGRGGKLFSDCREPVLVAFTNDSCFVKRVPRVKASDLAPGQANLEIWYQRCRDPENPGFMELENHGPYRTLRPGASMSLTETWEVLPYSGAATPEAQAAFIREHRLIKNVQLQS